MNIYQGEATAGEGRFAIVVSKFNATLTGRLLEGAVATLRAAGVAEDAIDVAWVPGAFEIPTIAGRLAETAAYRAVLCLGVVIRGETSHDQHINRAVSIALQDIALRNGLPVLFGVLTCNTLEQAVARCGGAEGTRGKDQPDSKVGNKGIECALAALEMVNFLERLPD